MPIVMLKVDCRNAFNAVSRAFLDVVRDHEAFNGAFAWVRALYGDVSHMWWAGHIIECVTGVQQGDPLGPLLFSLVLRLLTDKIAAAVPGLALNVWFLDDGTFLGKTSDVKRALEVICEHGPALGLHVDLSECELWWCTPNPRMAEFPPQIRRVTTAGVALLGSAVGDAAFVAGTLHERVVKVEAHLQTLGTLESSQVQLLLLQKCLGLPSVGYSMRTAAPQATADALARLEKATDNALQLVCGRVLQPSARLQAAQPVVGGGLGVAVAADVAEAAYLSSWSATRALQARIRGCQPGDVHVPHAVVAAVAALNARVGVGQAEPQLPQQQQGGQLTVAQLLGEVPLTQQQLMQPVYAAQAGRLLHGGTKRDRARLRSTSGFQAGAFLLVVPSWRYRMASVEHALACCLRLGVEVYPREHDACPACGALFTDLVGHHSTECGSKGDRIIRHDTQRDAFAASCTAAGLGTVVEKDRLFDGTRERPGDVVVAAWRQGQRWAFDIKVTSPVAASAQPRASQQDGHAAAQGEQQKRDKYADKCRVAGLGFSPIVVETFGRWGQVAMCVFSQLSKLVANESGTRSTDVLRWMYQRHSVLLQQDNARMMLARKPAVVPMNFR